MQHLLVMIMAYGLSGALHAADPSPEWTLYANLGPGGTTTTLVDLNGDIAHTWPSDYQPGLAVYLLDDGRLLRCCRDPSVQPFSGAGAGGRIEITSWDGTVEWSYVAAGANYVQHHDALPLPNGNVLAVVWERYSQAEAIAMGRDPSTAPQWLWSEALLEIEPDGTTGGNIVWEWRVWDHLVQDIDPALPNYGNPSDFPDRIDINFAANAPVPIWLHFNGLDYNEELDQIVVSIRQFSEIWVISHDPMESGGLLYRWGNPEAYGRGGPADQVFDGQHNPRWIREGLRGAGNIMVFNNGADRGYSSVDEITPPLNPDGTYELDPIAPFGPVELSDSCDTIDGQPFFSNTGSSAQRLANGNILIGLFEGDAIEIDDACLSVWSHDLGGPAFRATRIGADDERLEGLLHDGPCDADLNGDGMIDGADLSILLAAWGPCDCNADLNGDGAVDASDLSFVLGAWGDC